MKTVLSYAYSYEEFRTAYARTVFILLVAVCAGILMAYGYFLKSAAFSAAQWENDQGRLTTLSSEVSELESAYLARIQSLGMQEANALGLHETKTPLFVERGSDTGLSFVRGTPGKSE